MNNKMLKAAIILIMGSFLAVTLVFVIILFVLKGTACLPAAPATSTACTLEQASAMSLLLIENSPTFSYDGIKGSIKQIKAESDDDGQTWKLTYTYKTAHPGHGDRSGQVLEEAITGHTAEIILTKCRITSAVCDKTWDLLTNGQSSAAPEE
ncbi:MAG: hypothetical protein JXA01_10710 [Dehalococcoidia bacterium]|nr:hypothetical protein [Dehalococcoidia bacterium]